jgi:hypothetical protein
MTDLIKQLNTQFCTELNMAWMNATLNNDGPGMDMSRFNELTELITEAREQGYAFNLEYSPNHFIEECIMGKSLETALCGMPEWNGLTPILYMLKECETKNWSGIQPYFEKLKSQKMKPILEKYAIKCAQEKGPFFAGSENDTINIFGTCGSIAHEIILLSLLFGKH